LAVGYRYIDVTDVRFIILRMLHYYLGIPGLTLLPLSFPSPLSCLIDKVRRVISLLIFLLSFPSNGFCDICRQRGGSEMATQAYLEF